MRVSATSIADALQRIAGDGVRAGLAAERFVVAGVTPEAVVAPEDAAQTAEVIALCREHGWAVAVAGAGTWLRSGRRPERVDVVITTERMCDIVEYEPADLTVGAGAGMPLGQLQSVVGGHRQMLALDPPGALAGTVGATFATASAGPLRRSLGTPRDHALGLEVVTGDARVLNVGGRVVKNVAGYDLVRLFVGSRGGLGILTRLHSRLWPSPAGDATIVMLAAEPEPLVQLAPQIVTRVGPAALELLSPSLSRRLLGDARWALAVRAQGNDDAVRDARQRLGAEARRALGVSSASGGRTNNHDGVFRALPSEEATTFWAALREIEGAAEIMIRVANLPSELAATLALALGIVAGTAEPDRDTRRTQDPLSEADGEWRVAAHAGDGIVRVWCATRVEPALASHIARAVAEARRARSRGPDIEPESPLVRHSGESRNPGPEALGHGPGLRPGRALGSDSPPVLVEYAAADAGARRKSGGGTILVTAGAHLLSPDLEPFGDASDALRLMRALEREFDPDGILAPGRVFA